MITKEEIEEAAYNSSYGYSSVCNEHFKEGVDWVLSRLAAETKNGKEISELINSRLLTLTTETNKAFIKISGGNKEIELSYPISIEFWGEKA
jgi:hypothetical protein